MSVAAISCLVPGWVVVLLERLAIFRDNLNKLIMGQMAVRFLAVLGTCAVVKWRQPDLGLVDFYLWLIVLYLVAMVIEVMLLRQKLLSLPSRKSDGSSPTDSSIQD